MPITLDNLDGRYEVRSETSDGGPFRVNGDGVTEIRNGMTYRKDGKGFVWESAFSVLGEGRVQLESSVDPSHAGPEAFVIDEKGNPTKGIVTYRSILEARLVDGKIVMSGTISHGGATTRLTMQQL